MIVKLCSLGAIGEPSVYSACLRHFGPDTNGCWIGIYSEWSMYDIQMSVAFPVLDSPCWCLHENMIPFFRIL
jgi:hypothetical protein